MTFPSGTVIPLDNLNSGTSDPSLARADLLALAQAVNQLIASENSASGVLVLTGTGRIPSATLPAQISLPSGVQVINPTDGVVNIRDVLRMQPMSTADILALEDPAAGDIAFATDGAGGTPTLSFYNGTNWVRISVGAAISAT